MQWGTGIRGLTRDLATFSSGNKGAFSDHRQGWNIPGELGVSMSMECDTFSFQ